MVSHPDQELVEYIIAGLREGFRIGYDYQRHKCKRCVDNMKSAKEHPQVVDDYIMKECLAGRLLGPLDPQLFTEVQVSRFGVIPKAELGSWRLILDLSSPEGQSVNDGINSESCSLSYVTVDDAAKAIMAMGEGAMLAKVDIKSAYRIIPVHSEDRPLLGMMWRGALYVDSALPFGLRSAPKIFNSVADVLEWRLRHLGLQQIFHYLDDFLIVAPPHSCRCKEELQVLLRCFDKLGVPVAEQKMEGPTVCLTFLGIELDTVHMIRRLPAHKLRELQELVGEWLSRKSCKIKDLQSLVGKLQHACKVVRPGRTFLRRMFELLKGGARKQPWIRLNSSFRSDLLWWHLFLESWNGVAMLENIPTQSVDIHLYTDASGSFGCGAYWGNHWFQLQWPEGLEEWSIARKELLPIVIASMVWGQQWQRHRVRVHCDNEAVVEVMRAGYSKEPYLMHLLRCIFFVTAAYEITMWPTHVPGIENRIADAISRNNMSIFHSQVPKADPAPAVVPTEVIQLLIKQCPDWTSQAWSQWFKNCLQQV